MQLHSLAVVGHGGAVVGITVSQQEGPCRSESLLLVCLSLYKFAFFCYLFVSSLFDCINFVSPFPVKLPAIL